MSATAADRDALHAAAADPFGFALRALALRGALVEATGTGDLASALVVAPAEVAAALGLAEECRIAPRADADAVACGFGSPFLERLLGDARAEMPVAWARWTGETARLGQARSLAERFVVRNGLAEYVEAWPEDAVYVAATLAYTAESDDRREGTVRLVVGGTDGAEPDPAFGALLDAFDPAAELEPLPRAGALPDSVCTHVARRADASVRRAVSDFVAGTVRRHARDHQRIAEYFAEAIAEARSPRRRLDAATIQARVERLVAERDAKLAELEGRFTVRVRMQPAAILCVVVPAIGARLRLRRRRAEREIVLRLPPRASALDRCACDGCGSATARPALCDERLHLLCETCAPNPRGRLACGACGA